MKLTYDSLNSIEVNLILITKDFYKRKKGTATQHFNSMVPEEDHRVEMSGCNFRFLFIIMFGIANQLNLNTLY